MVPRMIVPPSPLSPPPQPAIPIVSAVRAIKPAAPRLRIRLIRAPPDFIRGMPTLVDPDGFLSRPRPYPTRGEFALVAGARAGQPAKPWPAAALCAPRWASLLARGRDGAKASAEDRRARPSAANPSARRQTREVNRSASRPTSTYAKNALANC